MQRVAIARALVNDPEIILADEPTGALDTETSVQVMELLKEVAKDRLVIMVTHNPELAEQYSTRIIRMLDGLVLSDSMPLSEEEGIKEKTLATKKTEKSAKKSSMSFFTAFKLSLRNLFTKKGRTMLTSFAGSIGIIGISLILAVSQGMTAYINYVQESTLSSYPISLQETEVDMTALMQSFMGVGQNKNEHLNDAVYKDAIIAELVKALSEMETTENDLAAFKAYLETELAKEDSPLKDAVTGIQYAYAMSPTIYTKNPEGEIIKSDVNELMMKMLGEYMMAVGGGSSMEGMQGSSTATSPMSGMSSMMMTSTQMWQELLPGLEAGDHVNDLLEKQYELVHGAWPNEKDEIVLVLNKYNELDDLTLYSLGLLSEAELDAIIDAAANKEPLPDGMKQKWSYEEICALTFKAVFPYDCYAKIGDVYADVSGNKSMMSVLYDNAMELKVVGIIRPDPDADNTMLTGTVGYTHLLTEHIIASAVESEVVKAQLASPTVDVLTGLPFASNTKNMTEAEKEEAFRAYVAELSVEEKANAFLAISCLEAEKAQLALIVNQMMDAMTDKDAVLDMIAGSLAEQMGGGADAIKEYLSEKSLDELKELMRPAMEEQAKSMIATGVEQQLTAMGLGTPALRAAALDAALAGTIPGQPGYTTEQCAAYYDRVTVFSDSSYEEVLREIGYLDLDDPSTIHIYASSFENKDIIMETIAAYNETVANEQKIAYTDYLGIMMSSITTIINAISYVLIAFVSISLVVSSIMIGVITLISVQERTKEIGILRAIGASKRDVSGMFNAETMIIGFSSGILGVVVTYLLCIPINLILNTLTGIPNLDAILPIGYAALLVGISVILTLFS
ncbi:MAG: FtsX-like permease family protein, partial [Clostridia bacterium]|nr:FtsX-like permease family protein [Clostridia bacterium]